MSEADKTKAKTETSGTVELEPVTKSDMIWEKIKDLPVEMYALPDQTLQRHVDRRKVEDDRVHLFIKSPAIVASLEEALRKVKLGEGESFEIVPHQNFIVVGIIQDQSVLLK